MTNFDGACQGTPGVCGGGRILYLKENHCISFKSAVGEGANDRAELYALCLLLEIASERGLTILQIMGDYKLIIEWANGKYKMENLLLLPNHGQN